VADIAKLSVGREAYTRELAENHEEYLSGHGESPGRWYGAGASSLGLEGEASVAGQAATSSMIRNYLGFPRGVSGAELAQRAYEQAWILGADFIYGPSAVGLRSVGSDRVVTLGDGAEATSRAVILATG
jgi:thioredoxin reductase (NADPH)